MIDNLPLCWSYFIFYYIHSTALIPDWLTSKKDLFGDAWCGVVVVWVRPRFSISFINFVFNSVPSSYNFRISRKQLTCEKVFNNNSLVLLLRVGHSSISTRVRLTVVLLKLRHQITCLKCNYICDFIILHYIGMLEAFGILYTHYVYGVTVNDVTTRRIYSRIDRRLLKGE